MEIVGKRAERGDACRLTDMKEATRPFWQLSRQSPPGRPAGPALPRTAIVAAYERQASSRPISRPAKIYAGTD